MSDKKFSLKDRIKSFGYALNGLKLFFYTEHNARIHLLAAILALAISLWLKISSLEWVAIISVIILVFKRVSKTPISGKKLTPCRVRIYNYRRLNSV